MTSRKKTSPPKKSDKVATARRSWTADPSKAREKPTLGNPVVHFVDQVGFAHPNLTAEVHHIDTISGKGYCAVIKDNGLPLMTTEVVFGTSNTHYMIVRRSAETNLSTQATLKSQMPTSSGFGGPPPPSRL